MQIRKIYFYSPFYLFLKYYFLGPILQVKYTVESLDADIYIASAVNLFYLQSVTLINSFCCFLAPNQKFIFVQLTLSWYCTNGAYCNISKQEGRGKKWKVQLCYESKYSMVPLFVEVGGGKMWNYLRDILKNSYWKFFSSQSWKTGCLLIWLLTRSGGFSLPSPVFQKAREVYFTYNSLSAKAITASIKLQIVQRNDAGGSLQLSQLQSDALLTRLSEISSEVLFPSQSLPHHH